MVSLPTPKPGLELTKSDLAFEVIVFIADPYSGLRVSCGLLPLFFLYSLLSVLPAPCDYTSIE